MKLMQKTRLSAALALAVGGAVIAASTQSVAAPQNPNVANGGLQAATPAAAGVADTTTPYVAHNALGQVLIMPYYTTRDNQRSAINVMNTSGDTIAVKATFREGKYSRDVLNFWILMSPYDTWTGFLSNSSGTPTLHRSQNNGTGEDTCVVGAFGELNGNVYNTMTNQTQELKTAALVDTTDVDTLQEGYVTFVAAGKVDTTYVRQTNSAGVRTNTNVGANFAAAVKHNDATGVPADCNAAAVPFTVAQGPITDITNGTNLRGNPALADLFLGLEPGENPLKGNMSILDPTNGIAGGTQMTAIANFNQDINGVQGALTGAILPASGATAAVVRAAEIREDLVTAQRHPYFYEPNLASGDGFCVNTGLTKVEDALRANSLINEWSQLASTGAETDWVVTFPSKGFRTDPSGSNPFALGFCRGTSFNLANTITSYDGNGRPNDSTTNPVTPRHHRDNGLPIFYSLGSVDREEKRPINAPDPSPNPFDQPAFPWEVNVLTFKPAGQSGPLASQLATNYDLATTINGTPNGWAEVKFTRSATGGLPVGRRLPGQVGLAGQNDIDFNGVVNDATYDVAAIGFAYKVRKQPGSAATNFGQIIDHSAIQASVGPVSP